MAHYMIIGVERTETKHIRYRHDLSNIPRHLIQTSNLYGKTYQSVMHHRYDAPVSIINADKVKDGCFNIIKVDIRNIDKFKQQYGLAHAPKKLDSYGNTNIPNNQPMIIINKIGNMGCQCVDVTGKVVNLRNEDVLKYANNCGIANAKVYEKVSYPNSTIVISGIGWTIPTISIEQLKKSMNNEATASEKNTTDEKRLEMYRKKLQLLGIDTTIFEIDFNMSTLTKCKPGNYDRLILPPVKVIGWDAFKRVNVKELVIPNSVKSISKDAFDDSSILTLIMEANIQRLDENELHIKSLEHLKIGGGVQSELSLRVISRDLQDVEVDEHNMWFISEDGIAYTKDYTKLVNYPSNHSQEVYKMPDKVQGALSTHTFWAPTNLKKIALSNNINRIEKEAFVAGGKLKEIVLGTGLQKICNRAIVNTSALREITIKSDVELQANKHYVIGHTYTDKPSEDTNKVSVIYANGKSQKVIESEQEAEKIIKDLFLYMCWKLGA